MSCLHGSASPPMGCTTLGSPREQSDSVTPPSQDLELRPRKRAGFLPDCVQRHRFELPWLKVLFIRIQLIQMGFPSAPSHDAMPLGSQRPLASHTLGQPFEFQGHNMRCGSGTPVGLCCKPEERARAGRKRARWADVAACHPNGVAEDYTVSLVGCCTAARPAVSITTILAHRQGFEDKLNTDAKTNRDSHTSIPLTCVKTR